MNASTPFGTLTGMVLAMRPLPEDRAPRAALDEVLTELLTAFARDGQATRAVVILLEPRDEAPCLRAAVPDKGSFASHGESLRPFLSEAPSPVLAAPRGDAPDGLAVAPFAVPAPDGGEVRGALAIEADPAGPGTLALPGAAALVGKVVEAALLTAAERAAAAAETASLRARLSAGFADAFGPGGCPGLALNQFQVERAARGAEAVLLWGEPGTGKTLFARLIHDLSPRAARPFVTARADDLAGVFGRIDEAMPLPGAVEDAAGGTLYVADVARLADDAAGTARERAEAAARLARLVREGLFSRCFSDITRRAGVRVVLGSSLPPRELARRVPALAGALGQAGDALRAIRLPPLRERAGDVPVLLQRAVDVQAGRTGLRLSFTSRAIRALCAYPWPGNDAEVWSVTAEAILSRTGERLDLENLPPRLFSLAPAAGGDGGGEDRADLAADTLWEMERDRVLTALTRHGWVRTLAARELGLTVRQLGWRMKRHGLSRPPGPGHHPPGRREVADRPEE